MDVSELVGQTINSVEIAEDKAAAVLSAGDQSYRMFHNQRGNENVTLYGVQGSVDDMIGEPIIFAKREVHDKTPADLLRAGFHWDDSYTWTIFNFVTSKGVVSFRWFGTSTGGLNEEVDFGAGVVVKRPAVS